MFSLNAFVTVMTAQEIANTIQKFYDEQRAERFFWLEFIDTAGTDRRGLWVQPHPKQQPYTLANGDQIIRCEAQGGETVDIVVPVEFREFVPATVVVARRSGVDQ